MDCIHRLRSRATMRFAFRTAAALTTLAFFALALAVFGRPAFAARPLVVSPVPPGDPVALVINGQQLWLDDQPFVDGGRTMLPFRALLETVGASVDYNPETHLITARRSLPDGGERVVVMTIGARDATVDGQPVTLDVPPKLYGDRTFIPLRFASEALGAKVEWVDSWREARVTIDGELKAGTGVRLPIYTQEYDGARLTYYGMEPTSHLRPWYASMRDTGAWTALYVSGNYDRTRYRDESDGQRVLIDVFDQDVPIAWDAGGDQSVPGDLTASMLQYAIERTKEPFPVPNAAPIIRVKPIFNYARMIGLRVFENRQDVLRVPYRAGSERGAFVLADVPGLSVPGNTLELWAERKSNRTVLAGNYYSGWLYLVTPLRARIDGGPWQATTLVDRSEWSVVGIGQGDAIDIELQGWWRLLGSPLAVAPQKAVPVVITMPAGTDSLDTFTPLRFF